MGKVYAQVNANMTDEDINLAEIPTLMTIVEIESENLG
jgi:hypothetical protein